MAKTKKVSQRRNLRKNKNHEDLGEVKRNIYLFYLQVS